ncbi:hypothetical protein B296_00004136, partial [Ensete ventricosum]
YATSYLVEKPSAAWCRRKPSCNCKAQPTPASIHQSIARRSFPQYLKATIWGSNRCGEEAGIADGDAGSGCGERSLRGPPE